MFVINNVNIEDIANLANQLRVSGGSVERERINGAKDKY